MTTQCHIKKLGCDSHIEISKAVTLERHPFDHARANIEECYDAIEEGGTSSNSLYNVCIEEETMHQ